MSYTDVPVVEEDILHGAYRGEGGRLFWLALGTGMLTLLTLGFYRFWAKTRVRRYLWSATAPGGNPFEYSGTGLEKFLGFLVAVVILAVYLGLLQLFLFFLGLNIFSTADPNDPFAQLQQIMLVYINLIAVLPLIFFAQYRARRYILSRTRWRGVRFGAEKGAWGYMFTACGLWLASAMTLGLLTPLMTFYLEKYIWDRTWYGDAKFTQNGSFGQLYKAMIHIFIPIGLLIGAMILPLIDESLAILTMVLMVVAYIWLLIGSVYYQIHSWRILWANKVLGDGIRFRSMPRTGTVIGTYVIGSLAVFLLSAVALIPLGLLIGGMGFLADFGGSPETMFQSAQGLLFAGLFALAYIFVIVFSGALAMVFIRQPILRHYVEESTVVNASQLDTIRQRVGDEVVDAEGFADALDVGAAF